jgi:hypothetical protein
MDDDAARHISREGLAALEAELREPDRRRSHAARPTRVASRAGRVEGQSARYASRHQLDFTHGAS